MIGAWIDRYNSRRRHSTLGDIAPFDWERQYHQRKASPQRDRPTGQAYGSKLRSLL
ncbi:MAG: transposase [Actinomycetia bacterium]|nr:transposase [Actinomycetes bacterium]